jgi:hypothetical protein
MKNLLLLSILAGANILALTGCVTNKEETPVVATAPAPTTTRTTTSESHTIRAY